VFYLYLCVDRALLMRNLGGDASLAANALGALTQAAATVAPRGKQNSFAAHGRASFVLAERGDQQPRTLAAAFARAVIGEDLMQTSIAKLKTFRKVMSNAYGPGCDLCAEMELGGQGSLAEIVAFARGDMSCLAT